MEQTNRRTAALALAAVALGGLLIWGLKHRAAPTPPALAAAPSSPQQKPPGPDPESDEGDELVEVSLLSQDPQPTRESGAPTEALAASAPPSPEVDAPVDSPGGDQLSITIGFRSLDRNPVEVTSGRLELTHPDGSVIDVPVQPSGTTIRISPKGAQVQLVDSSFHHCPETLHPAAFGTQGPSAARYPGARMRGTPQNSEPSSPKHDLTVWRATEIPIRVQTPDGDPVFVYSEGLGWKDKNFFWQALRFGTSKAPFEPRQEAPAGDGSGEHDRAFETLHHGKIRRPRGNYAVRIGDDVVAMLELTEPASLWLGMWMHGELVGTQAVDLSTREVVFQLDMDALMGVLGGVAVKVVDYVTGDAIPDGVQGTLKARTSSHRREDQKDKSPGPRGMLRFAYCVPGDYTLTVTRRGAIAERHVRIESGKHLELDPIRLRDVDFIDLVVVDSDGVPQKSCAVELAPYRSGAFTGELYHPNLSRHTDDQGRYRLPRPEGLSILRVRKRDGQTIASQDLLLDPDEAVRALRLVTAPSHDFQLVADSPLADGERLAVIDPRLNLRVRESPLATSGQRIPEGDYEVVRINGANRVISRRAVRIEAGVVEVRVP